MASPLAVLWSPVPGRPSARGTGATVLAILRGNEPTILPVRHERIEAGDVLALAGSPNAVSADRADLGSWSDPAPSS